MEQKSIFSVISPIMVGPSSSHTAGAVRLGLMARNIYKESFSKVKFVLYNSFATTGFGHGTEKTSRLGGGLYCRPATHGILYRIQYAYISSLSEIRSSRGYTRLFH